MPRGAPWSEAAASLRCRRQTSPSARVTRLSCGDFMSDRDQRAAASGFAPQGVHAEIDCRTPDGRGHQLTTAIRPSGTFRWTPPTGRPRRIWSRSRRSRPGRYPRRCTPLCLGFRAPPATSASRSQFFGSLPARRAGAPRARSASVRRIRIPAHSGVPFRRRLRSRLRPRTPSRIVSQSRAVAVMSASHFCRRSDDSTRSPTDRPQDAPRVIKDPGHAMIPPFCRAAGAQSSSAGFSTIVPESFAGRPSFGIVYAKYARPVAFLITSSTWRPKVEVREASSRIGVSR